MTRIVGREHEIEMLQNISKPINRSSLPFMGADALAKPS